MLTTDSEKEIQAYISNFPQCKLNRIQPTEIGGKREDLQVYSLPIRLLYFNIRNGRFAAEYKEKRSKLEETSIEGQERVTMIREMLLEQSKEATKLLKEDLCRVGQKNPGVITSDGAVINGNRRLAVFQQLYEEKGEEKMVLFRCLNASKRNKRKRHLENRSWITILPGKNGLDTGPINRLLKLREGIKAGLTPQQIAATVWRI